MGRVEIIYQGNKYINYPEIVEYYPAIWNVDFVEWTWSGCEGAIKDYSSTRNLMKAHTVILPLGQVGSPNVKAIAGINVVEFCRDN